MFFQGAADFLGRPFFPGNAAFDNGVSTALLAAAGLGLSVAGSR